MNKKKLLETIKDLPENFSIDELLDKVLLMQKIETGLTQSINGESKSTEQAKAKLKKWLK
ncbi:MAG: hypothetical protein JWO44_749 [Bacteroidetes bacterium]|nr:hypothetical protein [Bacteroidota bacterium]